MKMKFALRFGIVIAAIAAGCANDVGQDSAAAASDLVTDAPTLTASRSARGSTDRNLSTEGETDWARWGSASVGSFDHKSGVTQQISNFTRLGSVAPIWLNTGATYSWSGGTPTGSATTNLGGIHIDSPHGSGDGFRITVPADRTTKTLKVYLGNFNVRMKFLATLSDGSAAPYADTSWDVPTQAHDEQVYAVNFAAG
jgi:hypothetical protein